MQERRVWSLGQEYPLEKKWQPVPVFLPRKISWTDEPGRIQSTGSQTVGHNWAYTHTHTHTHTHTLRIRKLKLSLSYLERELNQKEVLVFLNPTAISVKLPFLREEGNVHAFSRNVFWWTWNSIILYWSCVKTKCITIVLIMTLETKKCWKSTRINLASLDPCHRAENNKKGMVF